MTQTKTHSSRSVLRWSLLTVPVVVVLGFLSGWLSGPAADSAWFDALAKPAIFPPPYVFGIVWPILYVLMGFALAHVLAAPKGPHRRMAVTMFAVQLVVNLLWSPIFFTAHMIAFAFVWILLLIGLVLMTMARFARVSRAALALLLPYLAWIVFAAVLNLRFWQLN